MAGFDQLYLISASIGFLYVIVTAAMGMGDSDGDGDGGADDAAADGPDSGGESADAAADAPDATGEGRLQTKMTGAAMAGTHTRSMGVFLAITKILSPLKIALILFFFGAFGIFLSHALPAFSLFVPLPAALLSFGVSNMMFAVLGKIMRKMEHTNSFQKHEAIGQIGQLSVPIFPGGTGEITFVAKGGRTHAPAKAIQSDHEISKSTRVIISDIKDGVYYVEPYSD